MVAELSVHLDMGGWHDFEAGVAREEASGNEASVDGTFQGVLAGLGDGRVFETGQTPESGRSR